MTERVLRNTAIASARLRQRGFTLLELTVVIIIVALLIYAGMRHFQPTIREANATAVSLNGRALLDGVRAAKMMKDVQGLSGAVYDLPRFGNSKVDLSAAGYPAGTSRKPGDRLKPGHCLEIWHAVTEANPEQEGVAAENQFTASLAKTGRSSICHYAYRRDERLVITYDPMRGEVKVFSGAR